MLLVAGNVLFFVVIACKRVESPWGSPGGGSPQLGWVAVEQERGVYGQYDWSDWVTQYRNFCTRI